MVLQVGFIWGRGREGLKDINFIFSLTLMAFTIRVF